MEFPATRAIRQIGCFRPFPFPLFFVLRGIVAGPNGNVSDPNRFSTLNSAARLTGNQRLDLAHGYSVEVAQDRMLEA